MTKKCMRKIKIFLLNGLIYILLGLSNLSIKLIKFNTIISLLTNEDRDIINVSPEMYMNERVTKNQNYVKFIKFRILCISEKTPWRSKCFEQVLTAAIIMRFLSLPYTIYFGLMRDEHSNLNAHTWSRTSNQYVTGFANMNQYETIYFKSYFKKV